MVSGFEWYGAKDQQENKSKPAINQPKTTYFAKKRTALAEKCLNKQNTWASKLVIKRSLDKSIEYRQKLQKALLEQKKSKCPLLELKDLPD